MTIPFDEKKRVHLFVPAQDIPFLHGYQQVDFGWYSVSRLAKYGVDLPIVVSGTDRWLYKAWALLRYGPEFLKEEDVDVISRAWSAAYEPKSASMKTALETLLMTTEATIENVADDTALSQDLVEAYEALFFNVIGRRDDFLFIRNVVYPNSKIVEMNPDYSKSVPNDLTLLRTAYNSDRATAKYFCGFRPDGFMDIDSADSSRVFQQSLMRTGAILASAGMLWMDRQHTTLSSARSFMQASKLAGEDTGNDAGLASISSIFRQEMNRISNGYVDEANKRARMG